MAEVLGSQSSARRTPIEVGPELGCEEVRSCLLLVPFEVFLAFSEMFVWVTGKHFSRALGLGPFAVGLMPEGQS